MRSRSKCSGSGRRAGLRRSNEGAVMFSAAAICAAVSAGAAVSSRSASCGSSRSNYAPRSEDCRARSFLIVSLSFSTSNIRGFASGGRAGCSLSAQHRLQRRHVIGGENHRRPSPTGEAPYAVSVRTAGVVSIQITAISRPPAVATCVAASASQCHQASSRAGAV
jgi:hypothetical protein